MGFTPLNSFYIKVLETLFYVEVAYDQICEKYLGSIYLIGMWTKLYRVYGSVHMLAKVYARVHRIPAVLIHA